MEDLDRKFSFIGTKTKDGSIITQKEGVIFLAKDNLLIPTLKYYLFLCIKARVGHLQIKGIKLLINRIEVWQKANPDKCKFPDVTTAEAENVCKNNEGI